MNEKRLRPRFGVFVVIIKCDDHENWMEYILAYIKRLDDGILSYKRQYGQWRRKMSVGLYSIKWIVEATLFEIKLTDVC